MVRRDRSLSWPKRPCGEEDVAHATPPCIASGAIRPTCLKESLMQSLPICPAVPATPGDRTSLSPRGACCAASTAGHRFSQGARRALTVLRKLATLALYAAAI